MRRASSRWRGKALLLAVVLVVAFWASACTADRCEPFPSQAIESAVSPDGLATANILVFPSGGGESLLGDDTLYFLSIQRSGSTVIVTRDLSEGYGTYEGGVSGVGWLTTEQVLIERVVSDQPANVVYEVSSGSWGERTRRDCVSPRTTILSSC